MTDQKTIYERQNEERGITLLSAYSELYTQAKKLQANALLWSFILPVICLIVFYFVPSVAKYWLEVSGVVSGGLLTYFIITAIRSKKKQRQAANLQEIFDTELLDIEHQEGFKRMSSENEIERLAIRYPSSKKKKLYNWYQDYSDEPAHISSLKCQMENLYWDGNQRTQYSRRIFIFLSAFLLILTIIVFQYFEAYAIAVYILFTPFISWIGWQFLQNWIAGGKIQEDFFDAKFKAKQATDLPLRDFKVMQREIQDIIYKSRATRVLIPNWYHNLFKQRIANKVYSYKLNDSEIMIEMKSPTYSLWPFNRVEKASQDFDKAFDSIDKFSKGFVKKLEFENYEEVTVEMGVKVVGDLGAVIAKASGEGQIKVTLNWKKGKTTEVNNNEDTQDQ
jgi:hypothetical protein